MKNLSKLGNTFIMASALLFIGCSLDIGLSNITATILGGVGAPFGMNMGYIVSGSIFIIGMICSVISIYLEIKNRK